MVVGLPLPPLGEDMTNPTIDEALSRPVSYDLGLTLARLALVAAPLLAVLAALA